MSETRRDATARAAVVELVEATPFPPPFPEAADEAGPRPRRLPARTGLGIAALTFVLIVGAGAAAWWFATTGRQTGLGTSVAGPAQPAVSPVATEIAVVAEDGVVLRGRLWIGDATGIVVAPGYSGDPTEAPRLAELLARTGHTVLYFNLRGQTPSTGAEDVAALPSDLQAALGDLRTRGVETSFVVGYRQSATAAVVLAAEEEGLDGVAAVFAYKSYEGLDATAAAASSKAPLLFIGAKGLDGGEEGAAALAAANGATEAVVLSARPPAASPADHFAPKVMRSVLEFVSSLE
jgi:hypothetical protein